MHFAQARTRSAQANATRRRRTWLCRHDNDELTSQSIRRAETALTIRQATEDSGGGTYGDGRWPQGESEADRNQSQRLVPMSNVVAAVSILGCAQTNRNGNSAGPHGQLECQARLSSGSLLARSETVASEAAFLAQQLFTCVLTLRFVEQHPAAPGRFEQQQSPACRAWGEHRHPLMVPDFMACVLGSEFDPRPPIGNPRFATTNATSTSHRSQRDRNSRLTVRRRT